MDAGLVALLIAVIPATLAFITNLVTLFAVNRGRIASQQEHEVTRAKVELVDAKVETVEKSVNGQLARTQELIRTVGVAEGRTLEKAAQAVAKVNVDEGRAQVIAEQKPSKGE